MKYYLEKTADNRPFVLYRMSEEKGAEVLNRKGKWIESNELWGDLANGNMAESDVVSEDEARRIAKTSWNIALDKNMNKKSWWDTFSWKKLICSYA